MEGCKILSQMWPKCLPFFETSGQGMCLFGIAQFCLFTYMFLVLLQNALVKGAANELASLYGTKYTYGPGATTICKSWLQNCTKKPHV